MGVMTACKETGWGESRGGCSFTFGFDGSSVAGSIVGSVGSVGNVFDYEANSKHELAETPLYCDM